ncbi:hypothetical protein [Vitiosangium sp. GDMCC 1.1324]|uniref:hypothetical protein n=1 Tax=Vitiosangium sp. (strain GDMCC 1.1324) TaxID=2138576 RepID=UPI000D38CB2A|nr:hypothetical protein [Vitiosangium sp. GDMCC 1.1324]PTL84662.1 hypothetical protein DAT35_06245 [Vitiosangium sp. GDMCC 1.1324]
MLGASLRKHVWPLLAAGVALALLLPLLASLLDLGFVADDFVHLVEDRLQPWYFSQDHLYRPLRNTLFRVLPELLGLEPAPYRFLVISGFFTCLALLFTFLRLQGVGFAGALSACVFAALYPRNQRVLFWFAASQDIAAACAVLTALIGWTLFRVRGSRLGYGVSLLAFMVGLGFKEPAIVLPALLVILDCWRQGLSRKVVLAPAFWRPYLGFLPLLALYGSFLWVFRAGRLQTNDEHGIYGFSSLLQSVLALARTCINLVLPFARPLALRDMSALHLGCAALVLLAVAALALWTRTRRWWWVTAAWVVVAALPTSIFARTNNGDQYLFLPMLGLTFGLAISLDEVFRSKTWQRPVASLLLMVYAFAGSRYLARAQGEWKTSGETIRRTLESARALSLPKQASSIVAVNIPHSLPVGVPIMNNGLKGVFITAGYPRSLSLEVNHLQPREDPAQKEFVQRLLACPAEPERPTGRRTLVWVDGVLQDHSGPCAEQLIEGDEKTRALAWLKP